MTAGHGADRPGIARVGSLDVVVPRPTGTGRQRFRGRLYCEGHFGPNETGFGMTCSGTVRRVRGIALHRDDAGHLLLQHEHWGPTELITTPACRAPDYARNGFSHFLLDLEQAAAEAEAWLDQLDPERIPAQDISDLRAMAEAVINVATAQAHLEAKVQAARERGRSWGRIAMALGTSRQAARERYEDRVPR